MDDQTLDRLVSAASPVDEGSIAALDLDASDLDLMEEIVSLRIDEEAPVEVTRPRWNRSRRIIAACTGVAALSLVVAGLVTSGSQPRFSALARNVAESNRRILPGTQGWKVTRADEFAVSSGEMTIGDGTHDIDIHWEPGDQYHHHIEKASLEGEDISKVEVLGQQATMFRYAGTTDYVTVLPPKDKNYTYMRGDLGSRDAYLSVLRDLREVAVGEWLSAMPASVISPARRASTVDKMLVGLPIPPGFDIEALKSSNAIKDRYQLGAQVSGAVACGWLDLWTAAKSSGDGEMVSRAEEAMASSHGWKLFDEMRAEGEYPEAVWEIADSMDGSKNIGSGKGKVSITGRESYASTLGCDDEVFVGTAPAAK